MLSKCFLNIRSLQPWPAPWGAFSSVWIPDQGSIFSKYPIWTFSQIAFTHYLHSPGHHKGRSALPFPLACGDLHSSLWWRQQSFPSVSSSPTQHSQLLLIPSSPSPYLLPSRQSGNFILFLYFGSQNCTEVQDTPVLSTVGQSPVRKT